MNQLESAFLMYLWSNFQTKKEWTFPALNVNSNSKIITSKKWMSYEDDRHQRHIRWLQMKWKQLKQYRYTVYTLYRPLSYVGSCHTTNGRNITFQAPHPTLPSAITHCSIQRMFVCKKHSKLIPNTPLCLVSANAPWSKPTAIKYVFFFLSVMMVCIPTWLC